jgi:hypothetical protein
MFQMNPLAAVGALAALVTHVVLGEELPSTTRTLPPHLGGTSTRHELYTLFSISTKTHISLVKSRSLESGETLRSQIVIVNGAEC